MTLLLVIILIASVITFIFLEQLSTKAKDLLNDDNSIEDLTEEGVLILSVRRHSMNGWIARFLEKMKYLEGRKESIQQVGYFEPEYIEGQDVKIQFLTFKITHAGLNARLSNWFGFKLFGRLLFFLLAKLLWLLLTIGGLLWLFENGHIFIP